jgi:acyl carrier protein
MPEVLPRVQTAFQRVFDLDPRSITLDTLPSDIPRWDSVGHATLVVELEDEFKFRFDDDEVAALENVRYQDSKHRVRRRLSVQFTC